ncbi:MAG: hypothetical protein HY319_22285 [Armatimonadetes bacterium]|nr:hypothetical protein [Armatimonadota bacterium]
MLCFLALLCLWSSLGIVFAWSAGAPWWSGAVLGSILLVGTLAIGNLQVAARLGARAPGKKLRGLSEETGVELSSFDGPAPFLFAAGWRPRVFVSRGLLEQCAGEAALLVRYTARCGGGFGGLVLTGSMALPALLRAMDTALEEYRRARGHPGPTDLLSGALLWLAGAMESVAAVERGRFVALDRRFEAETLGRALKGLAVRASTASTRPAWTRSFSALSPIGWADLTTISRLAAIEKRGPGEVLDNADPPVVSWTRSHPDLRVRLARLRGEPARPAGGGAALTEGIGPAAIFAGAVLALSPERLLAAPLVLGGAAWTLKFLLQFPLGRPVEGGVASAWRKVDRAWRGVPVRASGDLIRRDGWYLDDEEGSSVFLDLPAEGLGKMTSTVAVQGWLLGCPPRLVVGRIEHQGRTCRLFPLARRLGVALGALAGGTSWAAYQWMGI